MQNEKKVVELPIQDVLPNRFQPRIKFDENSINELSISIKKYGVIQPIVVRQIGTKYEIIAGERRYKASVMAGKTTIPAIICELSDKDSVEIALIENVQREDLTPIEKAISYKKILDMGYITQEELAEKVGKSQSTIANTLRLLNLADEVQEALLENKISERHARSLLKIKDTNKQVELLNRIINERLTVRKTDEEINKMNNLENQTNKNDFSSQLDEIVNIPDINENNSMNINIPGFMNIDNIEQNATDINVEPSKPEINMDKLLTPTENKNTFNNEVLNPEPVQNSKFFNFFDIPEDSSSPISNPPTYEVPNMSQINTPTYEVPNMPEVNTPTYEVPNMPEVNTPTYEMPNMPEVNTPTYEMPNMPEVNTPTYEVPNMSQTNTSTYEVPNMSQSNTPTYEVPNMPEVNIPTYEVPNMSQQNTPTYEMPNMSQQNTPTYEVPNMSQINTPTYEVTNMSQSNTPTYEVPNMPEVNIPTYEMPNMPEVNTSIYETPNMSQLNPSTYEMPNMPEVNTSIYEVPNTSQTNTSIYEVPNMPEVNIPTYEAPNTPIQPDEAIIPTIDIETPKYVQDTQNINIPSDAVSNYSINKPNIVLALNSIRECESSLEKMGFIIETEEIDFEDNYQVIFKIQK